MGSSGTNSFSDYPGSAGGGGSGGAGGGGGKADQCEVAVTDLALEEVALSEYFTKHKKPPPEKTKIRVRKTLVGGRVAVETESATEVVGYLPTAYNYLRQCIQKGWSYQGKVSSSSTGKVPKVQVTLAASK